MSLNNFCKILGATFLLLMTAFFPQREIINGVKVLRSVEEIKPIFGSDAVTVVLTSDNNYVFGLAVTIQSLLDNSSSANNYDLWVLDGGITEENRKRLMLLKRNRKNCSLRFFDMKSHMQNYKEYFSFPDIVEGHLNVVAYYRLFIPQMFHNYRKALYLDSDLAVLRDVAELYRLDMKENRIAAVVDYMAVIKRRKLCNDFVLALKGKKWQEYFNSGVLLFNVGKIDGGDFLDKNLKFICLFHGKFKYHDQDVLNALHSDDVLLLDSKWNMLYNVVRRRTGGRKPTRENAYVIHYASGLKPWNSRNLAYGDVWLEYAQKTPFYEDILKNIETCEAKKNNGTRK